MYNRKDSYYRKAKMEGYKSRAAYKLLELNTKYRLIKRGDKVLDLGAAPGGFSQVALSAVGERGKVVAVDLEEITGLGDENFFFIKGDMLSPEVTERIEPCAPFDVALSDMAPRTTGIRAADQEASLALARAAATCAARFLKRGGCLLFKLFDGADRKEFTAELTKSYQDVKNIRPDATRKSSFEMYVICRGFLGGQPANR